MSTGSTAVDAVDAVDAAGAAGAADAAALPAQASNTSRTSRQRKDTGMRRVLVHAAYQREYQNQRDAVLMQASKCAAFASRSALLYLSRITAEMKQHPCTVNYFELLPDVLVLRIVQLTQQTRGTYPLERKLNRDPNKFKYATLQNGVMLNVSNQPDIAWITENVNMLHLPEKYWKDSTEFGQTWKNAINKKHVTHNTQWQLAQRRTRDLKRFDLLHFREDFIPTFQRFSHSTDTFFSLWCVPLRHRIAGTIASQHRVYVYETSMYKEQVLCLLYQLLGKKSTAELTIIKSVQMPNRKTPTTVVFLLGIGVFRSYIENDILFSGFSSCLQDPRIEPISEVSAGAVIYI